MKNQYFGDIRDLFKYDLIQNIVTQSEILERCIWVPMLTANDASSDGERRTRPKAGWDNLELNAFIGSYTEGRNERNIAHLRTVRFFREPGFLVFSVQNSGHLPLPDFDQSSRQSYFRKLNRALGPNSLVFLDPDTGIEPRSGSSERHILLAEIAGLCSSMDAGSVLMVYQHHDRKQRLAFFRDVTQRISQACDIEPLYVSDNHIAFFFLPKADSVRHELVGLLRGYTRRYPDIQFGPNRDINARTP